MERGRVVDDKITTGTEMILDYGDHDLPGEHVVVDEVKDINGIKLFRVHLVSGKWITEDEIRDIKRLDGTWEYVG